MNRSIARSLTPLLAALAGLLGACTSTKPELVAPQVTLSPYDTLHGDVLWAVVPLRNESGFSQADALAISDQVVTAVEEVQGVRCVPLHRTIETMRAMKMTGVHSPGEARALASAMGVDGIIVGTVTAYEPFTPKFGIALALFAREGKMGREPVKPVDALHLSTATTENGAPGREAFASAPVSTVSEMLDAKNHQVLMDVQSYAVGRSRSPEALGWRRYTAAMDLYCEFAAHYAVSRLLDQEWLRSGRQRVVQADPRSESRTESVR